MSDPAQARPDTGRGAVTDPRGERLRHRQVAAGLTAWLAGRGMIEAVPPQLLPGGRSNLVWRCGEVVCKLSRPFGGTPLFPNDGAAEEAALAALAGQGIAPRLRGAAHTPWGRCLLIEYLDGPPRASGAGALGALLARLHRCAPWPGLRPLSCDPGDIRAEGLAILSGMRGAQATRLRRSADAPWLVAAPERPAPRIVPLHGDPVPGNLIDTPDGLRLIDWQCPALGAPAHDLALALSPAMQIAGGAPPLDAAAEAALLEGYGDPAEAAHLARIRAAMTWRMACHCLWRMARGHAVYAAGLEAELALLARLTA